MEEATVDENESKRETPRREGTTKRKVGQKKKRTNGGEKRKTNKKKREEEEVDDDDGTRSAGMRSAHEKGNAEQRRRKTKVATQTNLMNPTTTTTSATTSKQYRNATLWQRRNRTDSRPKKKHSKMASIGRRCLTKFDVVLFILGTISEDRVPVIVFALMATLTWNKIRRKAWKPSVTVRLRQFHSVVIKSSFF